MKLDIHKNIEQQLEGFHNKNMIPNIIFHGPSGSGKGTIVNNFVDMIYNKNKDHIKSFVMNVNCAHGKGIKFIRDELKFFAKINTNDTNFKTVILKNADKLTIDAQSALRRCIESFSHTTRFFIVVEDKYKLLKPILSRFCDIYISYPIIDGEYVNLHEYISNYHFNNEAMIQERKQWLSKAILSYRKNPTYEKTIDFAEKLYEKAYTSLDIVKYIENQTNINLRRKYGILLCIHKIKKEFRNEKLLLLFILNLIFIRSDSDLENIPFM